MPAKQDVYVDVIGEALSAKQLAVAKTVWARPSRCNPHLEMRDVEKFASLLLNAGEFTEAKQVWDQGVATYESATSIPARQFCCLGSQF